MYENIQLRQGLRPRDRGSGKVETAVSLPNSQALSLLKVVLSQYFQS